MASATAALLLAPAALAGNSGAEARAEANAETQAEGYALAAIGTETPVRLVSWDGDFELLKTSRRLRIWRSHVAYRMTVDAEGKATTCELTETFRRTYVADRLCNVLMAHHTFAPATDASGKPVEGQYVSQLSYAEMRERMD
ncbi:hypothetical protein MACH05_14530 [Qipengyuania nanhaisediminis]